MAYDSLSISSIIILESFDTGRAMAQAVSRRPLTATAWVRAQVNPVGFVVDKAALGQVFLRVLRFCPVNIIPPWTPLSGKLKKYSNFIHSPLHSSSSGDGQNARKGGRSPVRRQTHLHNQNTRRLREYVGHNNKRWAHNHMKWWGQYLVHGLAKASFINTPRPQHTYFLTLRHYWYNFPSTNRNGTIQ
jgi:hypothetical protein